MFSLDYFILIIGGIATLGVLDLGFVLATPTISISLSLLLGM